MMVLGLIFSLYVLKFLSNLLQQGVQALTSSTITQLLLRTTNPSESWNQRSPKAIQSQGIKIPLKSKDPGKNNQPTNQNPLFSLSLTMIPPTALNR